MEKCSYDISTNNAMTKTQLMPEKSLKLLAFMCTGHVQQAVKMFLTTMSWNRGRINLKLMSQ